jgi:hypothetical protein
MRDDPGAQGVLLIGGLGTGKTSVAVEVADVLEKRDVPYGVIDLDWLAWFSVPHSEAGGEHRMMLGNLRPILANYLAAGVNRLILARSIGERSELESLRAAVPFPIRVVRLTVPLPEIERRLRPDVTAARKDDLRDAAGSLEVIDHAGLEDRAVSNDRPIRDVAREIVAWLDW